LLVARLTDYGSCKGVSVDMDQAAPLLQLHHSVKGDRVVKCAIRTVVIMVLCVLTMACSASSEGQEQGQGLVAGAVTMWVERAWEAEPTWTQVTLSDDDILVLVTVSVANGTEVGIPIAPAFFRIATDDGLEHMVAPESVLLDDACLADVFVGGGSIYSCTVAFFVPPSAQPVAVTYVYPGANADSLSSVRAPVSDYSACDRCEGRCVDLNTSAEHCGACGVALVGGATCLDGEVVCPNGLTACDGECVDTTSHSLHCGGCDQGLIDGECLDGVASCRQYYTACGGECVALNLSEEHCGACDRRVPDGGTCTGGQFDCVDGAELCGEVCADLEQNADHCGGCGWTCPGTSECTPYMGAPQCSGRLSVAQDQTCSQACTATGGVCDTVAITYRSGHSPDPMVSDCEVRPDTTVEAFECICRWAPQQGG